MSEVKTILADDHRIFVEGLKTVLKRSNRPHFEIVGVAYSGYDLLEMVTNMEADLLILDLRLPQKDGLDIIKSIRAKKIPIRILVLTSYESPRIVKSAISAGADGYILKNKQVTELFDAVECLIEGDSFLGDGISLSGANRSNRQKMTAHQQLSPPFEDAYVKRYSLTKREMEILRLITQAMSNKEIARELFISDQTVSVHRKNIMRKLGVSNTAGLIRVAYDYALV